MSLDGDKNYVLPQNNDIAGFVDPIIGRTAKRDVLGYFGFPLIRRGETVTPEILDKAQRISRLFELISATEDL